MLNKIKNFIVEFKKDENHKKTLGKAFNLDNIRVVLICGYHVPDYLRKYGLYGSRRYSSFSEEKTKDQRGKELDAFFEKNEEIKKDNFSILNVNDLKMMYGWTFKMVLESILNEKSSFATTTTTTQKKVITAFVKFFKNLFKDFILFLFQEN